MADRKSLLETIEKAKAQLAALDEERITALRQEAGELGYDLVKRGEFAGKRGRRSADPNAPKRTYNVTPESKVQATIKRQTTRALNAGKSSKEAKSIGEAAGKELARKLGV